MPDKIKIYWDERSDEYRTDCNGDSARLEDFGFVMPDRPNESDWEQAVAAVAWANDIMGPTTGWGGCVAVDDLCAFYESEADDD